MRLHSISSRGFLSLVDTAWTNLDPTLNILVGPNGVGKSNLLRVVSTIMDGLAWVHRRGGGGPPFAPWESKARIGAGDWFDVGIDIEFDRPEEREALTAFVRASVYDASSIQRMAMKDNQIPQVPPERIRECAVDLADLITEERLSWLFRGRLSLRCWPRSKSEWLLYYSCKCDDGTMCTVLLGPNPSDVATPRVLDILPRSYGMERVVSRYYDRLSDAQKNAIRSWVVGETVRPDLPPMDVAALAGAVSSGAYLNLQLDPQGPDGAPYGPYRDLLHRVELSSHIDWRPTLSWLFRRLVERSVYRTENVRFPPRLIFPVAELVGPPNELGSGEALALRLFGLKNGTAEERGTYERVRQTFTSIMPGKRFDVAMVPHQEAAPKADPDVITLRIFVVDAYGEVPLEFSGAGLTEALWVSAMTELAADRVLLLDEPALNMYPSAQRRLIQSLMGRRGQTLLVTHAPYMVPVHRIDCVRRASMMNAVTTVSAPFCYDDQSKQGIQLPLMLERSRDTVAALFAAAVLVVEGGAETAALPVWFAKHTGGAYLDEYGILLYGLFGVRSIGTHLPYLEGLNVPWITMCDGDTLAPLSATILRDLERAGLAAGAPIGFDAQKEWLRAHNIYVLGDGPSESFETKYVDPYRRSAPPNIKNSNPALARWVAEQNDCPPEIGQIFDRLIVMAGMQGR